jgi:hypothetical protein
MSAYEAALEEARVWLKARAPAMKNCAGPRGQFDASVRMRHYGTRFSEVVNVPATSF